MTANDKIIFVFLLSVIFSSGFLLFLWKLEREKSGGEILKIKGLHQETFWKLGNLVSETNVRLFFMLGWLAARQQGLGWFSGLHSDTAIIAPITFSSIQDSPECHHQREECHAWLTLRRISNPTPCTGWQRCFKNNQNSFTKAKYFITVWTCSCHVNPNAYLCFWAIKWRFLWFNHFLSCSLFLTFYMFKRVQKWNLFEFLDALAMNLQKEITLKKHI